MQRSQSLIDLELANKKAQEQKQLQAAEIAVLEAEIASLKMQLARAQSQSVPLETQLQNELITLQAAVALKDQALEARLGHIHILNKQLSGYSEMYTESVNQVSTLEKRISELQSQKSALENTIASTPKTDVLEAKFHQLSALAASPPSPPKKQSAWKTVIGTGLLALSVVGAVVAGLAIASFLGAPIGIALLAGSAALNIATYTLFGTCVAFSMGAGLLIEVSQKNSVAEERYAKEKESYQQKVNAVIAPIAPQPPSLEPRRSLESIALRSINKEKKSSGSFFSFFGCGGERKPARGLTFQSSPADRFTLEDDDDVIPPPQELVFSPRSPRG